MCVCVCEFTIENVYAEENRWREGKGRVEHVERGGSLLDIPLSCLTLQAAASSHYNGESGPRLFALIFYSTYSQSIQ